LTKLGLERAKARGVKLGGLRPRTEASNNGRRLQAIGRVQKRSKELGIICELRAAGMSFADIANTLNNAEVPSLSGSGKWGSGAVYATHLRLLDQASSAADAIL